MTKSTSSRRSKSNQDSPSLAKQGRNKNSKSYLGGGGGVSSGSNTSAGGVPVCRLPIALTQSLAEYLLLKEQSKNAIEKVRQNITREKMEECIKLAKKEEAHIVAILESLQRVIEKTEENEERKQYLPKNTQVCAKVIDPSSGDPMWILAKITNSNPSTDEYEIEDVDTGDDDDPEPHKSYSVQKSDLVLIPKSFSQHLGFEKGIRVLAMYPDTTCFYPATIADIDGKDYYLHFDDDDENGRTPRRKVNYKYVCTFNSE